MNNTKYYDGYEGEPGIIIYLQSKGQEIYELSMWDGYFEPMMQAIMVEEINKRGSLYEDGIVLEWNTCIGWCYIHSRRSKIHNIDQMIEELSLFDSRNLAETDYKNINEDWVKEIEEMHALILSLLKRARDEKCDVYIEND
ncbi:hypothetical protein [Clostridium saccharoperbutylacetonicum]|uniref:hypothetical protein n=1 Tax=Clostridium saccharoperbutylacetonicum TaxID=36745 RepID=UPI0009839354|nr:hypothetical protein [Clostridium saccharoperbutylacetonicum]AQR96501.1 hypothetical protein CLSAP_38250 [Clostridium saccharoperbutylacetonicum]NSB32376.1 hypothetical protein [Clostridium saccharoperbutylacetonicum]